ncbi:sodium:proton antiporter [Methylovirgula sp. HY1]|uniref:sodium:proton antiporter n=1 Tax=Methylovirgula sp. HY1 TaxID=2822761 RepID=UPI001C5BC6D6|nr:sodium:proton antiporter [Methylovirgula sp. HY1]
MRWGIVLALAIGTAAPATAAEQLRGAEIPLWEGLPFAGLLLSIALGPIFARKLWHVHYGKAAAFWAMLALGMLVVTQGLMPTVAAFLHSMLADYLPFILMLFALYTAAGGIVVSELKRATPLANTALLALGTLAASVIGTTGASMILIRPILQANAKRPRQVHVVIFFIFLVSNIGGVLSPLGDPPLFFGFLRGISFFWPLHMLWPQMLFCAGLLLIAFFLLDSYFFRKEKRTPSNPNEPWPGFTVRGLPNLALIAAAVGVILTSAVWRPGISVDVLDIHLELQNVLRDVSLLAIGIAALMVTPLADHKANHFVWAPFTEVAKIFVAIFIAIIPVITMLAAGARGSFAPVIALLAHADGKPNEAAYFWATGLLSSFLDNAPTYLVFFGMAGGDPTALMGPLAKTLEAISLGAVFMGAFTYIGNAPNFMVYAMARRARVEMPGFFGYMIWSIGILVPMFVLVTVLFLR